jgi:hypothetical protein
MPDSTVDFHDERGGREEEIDAADPRVRVAHVGLPAWRRQAGLDEERDEPRFELALGRHEVSGSGRDDLSKRLRPPPAAGRHLGEHAAESGRGDQTPGEAGVDDPFGPLDVEHRTQVEECECDRCARNPVDGADVVCRQPERSVHPRVRPKVVAVVGCEHVEVGRLHTEAGDLENSRSRRMRRERPRAGGEHGGMGGDERRQLHVA